MRYMMLIYNQETESASPEEMQKTTAEHWALVEEATRLGIFRGAEPLEPTATTTTVRIEDGKAMLTDGPFAETKEQLAGYYILDCKDLDEALEWAVRIPTRRGNTPGCVEVRPIREVRKPPRDWNDPE